jgi:hypothetical protein
MIIQNNPLIVRHEDLEITQAFNGYYIEHLPSGEERGMGDGSYLADDVPGTEAFNQAVDHDLTTNYAEFVEAYFPE